MHAFLLWVREPAVEAALAEAVERAAAEHPPFRAAV